MHIPVPAFRVLPLCHTIHVDQRQLQRKFNVRLVDTDYGKP